MLSVDTTSLIYLPRRSSKNSDLQFANIDMQTYLSHNHTGSYDFLIIRLVAIWRTCDRSAIYTTIEGLSSKCDGFLAARSQFDSVHGVDFPPPTCCQSATFVRPLFEFYCPVRRGKTRMDVVGIVYKQC